MALTKEELREKVLAIFNDPEYDPESGHDAVDRLLIEYVDDKEITEAFSKATLWYS